MTKRITKGKVIEMADVTYTGPLAILTHTPAGGSGTKYVFLRGMPTKVDNDVDVKLYKAM